MRPRAAYEASPTLLTRATLPRAEPRAEPERRDEDDARIAQLLARATVAETAVDRLRQERSASFALRKSAAARLFAHVLATRRRKILSEAVANMRLPPRGPGLSSVFERPGMQRLDTPKHTIFYGTHFVALSRERE